MGSSIIQQALQNLSGTLASQAEAKRLKESEDEKREQSVYEHLLTHRDRKVKEMGLAALLEKPTKKRKGFLGMGGSERVSPARDMVKNYFDQLEQQENAAKVMEEAPVTAPQPPPAVPEQYTEPTEFDRIGKDSGPPEPPQAAPASLSAPTPPPAGPNYEGLSKDWVRENPYNDSGRNPYEDTLAQVRLMSESGMSPEDIQRAIGAGAQSKADPQGAMLERQSALEEAKWKERRANQIDTPYGKMEPEDWAKIQAQAAQAASEGRRFDAQQALRSMEADRREERFNRSQERLGDQFSRPQERMSSQFGTRMDEKFQAKVDNFIGAEEVLTRIKDSLKDYQDTSLWSPVKKTLAAKDLTAATRSLSTLIGRNLGERGVFTDKDREVFTGIITPGLVISELAPEEAQKRIGRLETMLKNVKTREIDAYREINSNSRLSTVNPDGPPEKPNPLAAAPAETKEINGVMYEKRDGPKGRGWYKVK